MMKDETTDGCGSGGGGGNSWARVCDTCRAAACTVYCKADMAYLCSACDARVHAANRVAFRHERVSVCESCEQAPAAFLCKADAASLCAACDADIHSANPLARRHQRVPILPISLSVYRGRTGTTPERDGFLELDGDQDEEEATSWLLLNPGKNGSNGNNGNNIGFLFGGEVNEYLDLVDYNGENQYLDHQYNSSNNNQQQQQQFGVTQKGYLGDSVVPVQCELAHHHHHNQQNFQLGLEYDSSKAGYSHNSSFSHSVSVSSTDIGVVPESTMSEISISHSRPPKGTINLFSGPPIQTPPQLTPMDREARVLRYREKKKARKFEKTIRYASRKAYAETRPRIKGRFAKRTDVEVEVDQIFSTTLMIDPGYGIVPSF